MANQIAKLVMLVLRHEIYWNVIIKSSDFENFDQFYRVFFAGEKIIAKSEETILAKILRDTTKDQWNGRIFKNVWWP